MIAFGVVTLTLAVFLYCTIIIDVHGLECYECGAITDVDPGCNVTVSCETTQTYCLITVIDESNPTMQFKRACKKPDGLFKTDIGCADDAEIAGFKNLTQASFGLQNFTQYCVCNTNLCNLNLHNAGLNIPNDPSTTIVPTTPTSTDGSSCSSLELAWVLLFISNAIFVYRF